MRFVHTATDSVEKEDICSDTVLSWLKLVPYSAVVKKETLADNGNVKISYQA